MKKVLFTTTALVASAGFAGMAAAQVSISGSAEMGIVGGDIVDPGADPQFHTDIDVTFTMSGATDNGLTFGASVDLDDASTASTAVFGNTTAGGESIFLSGSFGTINAGDVDGALDARLADADQGPATLNDDHTVHIGWNDNLGLDGTFETQRIRYDYTFGSFTASASAEIDDTDAAGSDDVFGIGGSYALNMTGVEWEFGAGYQTGGPAGSDFDVFGLSVTGNLNNGLQFLVNYVDLDDGGGSSQSISNGATTIGGNPADSVFNIGAAYTIGAISVGANYGQYDLVAGGEDEGYGFNLGYDLGGGAEVEFGYGNSNPETGPEIDSYSFGVSFSF